MKHWWSYEKNKTWVQKMKIKTEINFHKLHKAGKLPSGIPSSPRTVYKKEWKGWGDFLGTGRIANQNIVWPSIKEAKIEARRIAKELGITTIEGWIKAHKDGKISANLPRYLYDIYGDKKQGR